jgi:hypothetical protein
MPLAQQLLADLGLEMHVGTHTEILSDDGSTELVTKASKTECIFFPSPGYFKQLAISNGTSENDILRLLDGNIEEDNDETRDERTSLEDSLYESSPETAEVPMIDGFVSYCLHFKYLGTWISYTLRDDYDIAMRIANSTKAMGALGEFFDRHEVSVRSKYLVFMAIPVNLLLWGCESWALRRDLLLKIERSVNRNIRRIMGISMTNVMENHIKTEQLREMFNDIPSMQTLIDVRTMQFLGKLIRGKVDSPPRKLLIAFIPNLRKRGRPITCNREAMWKSLCRLLADVSGIHVDRCGSLKDWYLDALDDIFWTKCIEHLRDPKSCDAPNRPNANAIFNPRRSSRHSRTQNEHVIPPRTGRTREPPSPRTRRNRRSFNNDDNREYNPDQVGNTMFDSLKILGLGYAATYAEVKAKYRAMARMYHPDQHNPERTGLTHSQAVQLFKLINNAHEYLRSKLN